MKSRWGWGPTQSLQRVMKAFFYFPSQVIPKFCLDQTMKMRMLDKSWWVFCCEIRFTRPNFSSILEGVARSLYALTFSKNNGERKFISQLRSQPRPFLKTFAGTRAWINRRAWKPDMSGQKHFAKRSYSEICHRFRNPGLGRNFGIVWDHSESDRWKVNKSLLIYFY